ncbi:MAG: hypothetical protein V2I66_14730 [Halieaceae bacterium]|nr:hypothetical protein [Halieaceae bacterium]
MRGYNERELKELVQSEELRHPRVDSDGSSYQLRFDLGVSLRDAQQREEADGTLTTFRGHPKRFRSHRTLIQNLKKLGIARWHCRLDASEG